MSRKCQLSILRAAAEKQAKKRQKKDTGELGDSNPRPPAPEAGIIPLDQIPRVLQILLDSSKFSRR